MLAEAASISRFKNRRKVECDRQTIPGLGETKRGAGPFAG